MSVAAMERKLEGALGWGEPRNPCQVWYGNRNGSAFDTAAWCDMLETWAAYFSGNYSAVCFGKDYAYTPYHAQAGYAHDRWHWGYSGIRHGDIVFYQWEGGARSFEKIDHVGFVTEVHSSTFETIEGNTSDRCARRLRAKNSTVTGYIRPAYSGTAPSTGATWTEELVRQLPEVKKGDRGEFVQNVQGLCVARSHPIAVDGKFGSVTESAVKAIQRWGGVDDDGIVGPKTWPVLLRIH